MLIWVFRVVMITAACLLMAIPATGAGERIEKEYRVESRETHNAQFYVDFFTLFSPEALELDQVAMKAAYDVLISAARLIEDGHHGNAADHLAVLPDEIEAAMRPVTAMREDMLAIDPIRLFADHEARGELMKYHREVWTSHPEFAEDFNAFGEDLAKRASRRLKDEGAPYIIEHLNDYGFVPKDEGGPLQAYRFLWVKFSAISKLASVCEKIGLDYVDVSVEEFEARVAWSLAESAFAAKQEAWDKEQGILSWAELIDRGTPEDEIPFEETPDEETITEEPEVEELIGPETEPGVEEEAVEEVVSEEPPVSGEEEEPVDELQFEVLINPLLLFTPPPGVEESEGAEATPPEEEEVVEEEVIQPPEPVVEEETEEELIITPFDVAESAESETTTTQPVIEPVESTTITGPIIEGELPDRIDAIPVPPGEVSGELSMGTDAETGPVESSSTIATMDEDEIRLRLAVIAEEAIDNAAEKGLELGRQALELVKLLIDDPKYESDETREQLENFSDARSEFLAASAHIDRYELEQYLDIPIEMIEEEIIAELRRPYDDLKTSPSWDEYRENEADFDGAYLRTASDFRERRTKQSIYTREMAALEAHIVDYEGYMLELEELLAMLD